MLIDMKYGGQKFVTVLFIREHVDNYGWSLYSPGSYWSSSHWRFTYLVIGVVTDRR